MPKLAGRERPCASRATFGLSRLNKVFKVIPTNGYHRRVRRELVLWAISGERLISSRTGWVANSTDATPYELLTRTQPRKSSFPTCCPTPAGRTCREPGALVHRPVRVRRN